MLHRKKIADTKKSWNRSKDGHFYFHQPVPYNILLIEIDKSNNQLVQLSFYQKTVWFVQCSLVHHQFSSVRALSVHHLSTIQPCGKSTYNMLTKVQSRNKMQHVNPRSPYITMLVSCLMLIAYAAKQNLDIGREHLNEKVRSYI